MKPGKVTPKISRMTKVRFAVAEMLAGKQGGLSNSISKRLLSGYYVLGPSVDYSRNDYKLFRSLYYASLQTKTAKEFLLAASFARPIVDAVAGFALAPGFKVKLRADGVSTDKLEKAAEGINDWTDDNDSVIFDAFTHRLRDGDAYLYVDELGNLDEADAETVEVILDPVSGDVIGYDLTEKMRVETQSGIFEDQTIIKRYRLDSIVYTRFAKNDPKTGKVIYSAAFTEDGVITDLDTETKMYADEDFLRRPLPIIHFANDKEPRAIYGNSELQNVLLNLKQYSSVLDNATAGVIYNSNPIPYATGQSQVQNNQGKALGWSPDMFLTGDKDTKFGFLQATGIMDDASKLLEIYFYLIVQASQTPEFLFGTAVASSKASTESQMPIMIQKAQRKRKQLKKQLKMLVQAYVDRMIYLGDPLYTPFKNKSLQVSIVYPDIVDEDKKLNLEIVKYLYDAGLITKEKAVEIAAMRFMEDVNEEVAKAAAQVTDDNANNNITPEEPTRIEDELLPEDDDEV